MVINQATIKILNLIMLNLLVGQPSLVIIIMVGKINLVMGGELKFQIKIMGGAKL